MNHYIEIKLNPDDDFPVYFLRNTCFKKLHKALFTLKANGIGVSFPNCTKRQKSGGVYFIGKLGDTIRLHGSQTDLQTLQNSNWLGGLSGYCEVSDIMTVPEKIEGYRAVSRIQPTMTLAKLKKRVEYQKANGDLKTDEEVETYKKQYKAKMFTASLDNPYLELQSASTGEKYRIFIQFGVLQDQPVAGEFNRFGLSKVATIPWF